MIIHQLFVYFGTLIAARVSVISEDYGELYCIALRLKNSQ